MILINLIVRVLTQVVHFPARIPNLDSHISVCTCYATYSSICPAGNFPSLGKSGNVASVSIDFRVNSKLPSSLPEVFYKKGVLRNFAKFFFSYKTLPVAATEGKDLTQPLIIIRVIEMFFLFVSSKKIS